MIRACIFDLDGVIVDTARYHYLAWKRLAYELGIDFTEADNERLKGVSRIQSLEIILEIGGVFLTDAEKEKCAERKNGWFVDYINAMSADEIFPGVKELLNSLRTNDVKVAIASSSKNAKSILERLGVSYMFDVIVDGNMIDRSKPDPEIFQKTASLLDMTPEQCLVFEDAEAGVQAAHRAGMRVVGIGNPAVLFEADMILSRTGEFNYDMLNSFKDERVS